MSCVTRKSAYVRKHSNAALSSTPSTGRKKKESLAAPTPATVPCCASSFLSVSALSLLLSLDSAPRGFSTDFERSRDIATSVRTGSQTCKDTPRHSSGVHTSVHTADCLLGTTERGKNGQRGTRSVGKLSPTPGTRKTTTVPNPGWRKARQRRKRRRKTHGPDSAARGWPTPGKPLRRSIRGLAGASPDAAQRGRRSAFAAASCPRCD